MGGRERRGGCVPIYVATERHRQDDVLENRSLPAVTMTTTTTTRRTMCGVHKHCSVVLLYCTVCSIVGSIRKSTRGRAIEFYRVTFWILFCTTDYYTRDYNCCTFSCLDEEVKAMFTDQSLLNYGNGNTFLSFNSSSSSPLYLSAGCVFLQNVAVRRAIS